MRKIRKALIMGIILGLLTALLVYASPSITISSPGNVTISDITPDLNFTISMTEPSNITYNLDGEGNISGCRNCTSYNTMYGEYVNPLEQNISALWHFNENFSSMVYDDSENDNNGTIYGATWTTGKFGSALDFDGIDDYVEVPDSVSLSITDELTVIAWIKPGSWTTDYHNIVEKYPIDWGLYLHEDVGDISVFLTNTDSDNYEALGVLDLSTNTWHCVAGTYDGSKILPYLNGALDGVGASASGTLETSGDSLRIGGNGIDAYFNGTIDEVAIFNRALSESEISSYCNKTLNDGIHNLTIFAKNATGYTNFSTQYFKVDTVPPHRIDTNYPANNSIVPASVNFNWTSYDATSNMSSNITIDGTVNVSDIITKNGTSTNQTVSTFTAGSYNWSITAWDDADNSNSSITSYFTVDSTPPYYTVNYTYPATPKDNENVDCSSYWMDNQGLDSAIIEENATGIPKNHTVSLVGNESWGNYTIDASILEAGTVQCKIYANDTVGNMNSTPAWIFTVSDSSPPSISNIVYSPSTLDDLDPNITINITVNITDFTQVDTVILQYKNSSTADWTNFTMDNPSGDIYQGNFTPDTITDWTFKIWANDSGNNINTSASTTLSIDYDWTWTRIPSSFGSPNGTIGTNITVGDLVINNTGDYDLNFELSSILGWISFNTTNASAINISNGSTTTIQVNATVPVVQGTYPVTITIDATNASAAPDYNTTTATLLATAFGPFLYVEIPTYDPSVTQGDTGVNLSTKVTNRGNDSAYNVSLAWILPSGWSNTSGVLNKSKSNLGVTIGNTLLNSITTDIGSSASTGTQTLRVEAVGVNATGDTVTGNASVSVTVNSVAAPSPPPFLGGGPIPRVEEKIVEVPGVTIIEVAPPSYSPTSEEKEKLFQSIEALELVRGFEYTFVIKITNPFPNVSLENITLILPDPFLNATLENENEPNSSSGDLKKVRFANPSSKPQLKFVDLSVTSQPEQYIDISPISFPEIEYGETKEFIIKVKAPQFIKKGIYPVSSTVDGKALYRDYPVNISDATGEVLSRKNFTTDMLETKTINLIVYTEVSPTYSPTPKEKEQLFQSIEILELVRGFDETFSVKITNPLPDSILQDVDLSVTGLLDEYLDVTPKSYSEIGYGETKEFEVRVATPTYFEKGAYPLSAALTGSVFYPDYPTAISDLTGNVLSSKSFLLNMMETKTIDLIVHAIPRRRALSAMREAEGGIAEMASAGFSTSRALKFSNQAKEAMEQGDYQTAEELSQEILNIKETAFKTHTLIQDLKDKIEDAENRGLKVIETKDLLYLASAAFEREDYETAQQKIKDAQILYSLETKGKVNYTKILLDYWYFVLLTIFIAFIVGIITYQKVSLLTTDRRLRGLGAEEVNIANLIEEARVKYYAEKTMTSTMYHETIDRYEERLVEIRQKRAKLRARRRKSMRLSEQLESLKNENQSLSELIKEAQDAYYNKKTLSREEYQKSIDQHKERKAEVEENIAMLELKLAKDKRVKKI